MGIGTWYPDQRQRCVDSVLTALGHGYRHVDTAQQYDTEKYVGEAIQRSDVPREEITVATKVRPSNLSYDRVLESTKESLDALGVETIDLLYVHYPLKAYDVEETMAAFTELYEQGLIDNIGLSNYSIPLLDEAMDVLDVPVFAHQVEMHPLLQQQHLLEHARKHDYWLVAYRPLVGGKVMEMPALIDIAEKHDVTPAQVSLAWLLSKERVAVVPKATGDHVAANWDARQLELTADDVARIDAISREERTVTRESSVMIHDEPMPWEET
ncbi:aldo/keto reductase [Haloferax sp. Atlit-4N]|uniref:2,5-diketo-D-gluconate reductase B n=1 Tax=Haloferax gibbonsii (strain ATCC 33959 / DSM 4427 / JCM 8863 / NBRC 102184 / NCIMB 2188 / Ma 2.38) TaxID=1227459 RepID=M0HQ11_HALGM|nr:MULTISPECIES: aldo/keto reductase [Haloferax]ELZ85184.1 2,5-diketo-D-gluconate reductase B [Haloferax gibbonsii ATCC 33959]RDZ51094.1 aldo/keto reductase [Haloferax sp. Atlit-4N]